MIFEYHPEAIVQVYDSKGLRIFESAKGYTEPWDGKYEGEFVSMGTYYYLIYLNEGEIIKVDTRTGEYVERVKKK